MGQTAEKINEYMRFDRKAIRQESRFVYLGGIVTRDGKSEAEVRRRIQVGANVWRRVEGVMADKDIEEIERESSDVVCNAGLPLQFGYGGTDRKTTKDVTGLQEQLGQEDYSCEEGG